MKISLDWLSDFIEITEKDGQKIKDIITERSAEIETMEAQGGHLDKIVVGKVTELKKHPDADKLSLTKVFDGHEEWQVVCGGSNLKEGMLVAFAQLGAVVKWHGTEVVKMEKAKIRGQESFGMICAADEIGLADMFPKQSEKEIVDLSGLNLNVGEPLAKALGLDDVVLDVDNHAITNRSDLFSQRGFAREFVANELGKWKKLKKTLSTPENNPPAPIEINFQSKEACSRYIGVYLTDVEVKDSPDWMKKRLIACGINPISNLVDITNYVMLELGMPLHAFDLDQIKGKKWTMREAKKGEILITLDQQKHELKGGEIVLDDGQELFDLCGIMGGYNSGINQHTKRIWLHAPVYHPGLVRKGMRGLGHVTDAGVIYEKGVDNELANEGLTRAVELILELCPGAKIASEKLDFRHTPTEAREIELNKNMLLQLIGIEIESKKVEDILENLGFEFKKTKSGWQVSVPSFRLNDIQREADLIEEIARIYGYNNIPAIIPVEPISPLPKNKKRSLERKLKEKLVSYGYDEIYTFAFLGPELIKKTGLEVSSEMIEVTNPISSDMSLMRTSLLPRTLETIGDNLRYQGVFQLFELSKVYRLKSENEHEETSQLILAQVGGEFREIQGVIESFGFNILNSESGKNASHQHPGRTGAIVIRGKEVGKIYEVHPQVLKNFNLKERVFIAEIQVNMLDEMGLDDVSKYQEINRFPAVKLDISLAIPKKHFAGDYKKTILATDKKLITKVELIDEYSGDKIASDKRALTYSITYQAPDRTLTEQEVNAVHDQVLERLKKAGGEVRI